MKIKIIIATVFLLLFAWSIYPQEKVFTERPTPLKNPILNPDELFFTAKVSDNCTHTYHEGQHLSYKWWNGYNVIWNDVACGFQSEVYAPDFLNKSKAYIVSVHYNNLAWDYVELKWLENGETMKWLIWHIDTRLKDGDIVVTGQRIGQTNLSGATTGHHTHIELFVLWKNREYNISYMQLYHNEMEKRKPIEKPKEYTYDNQAIFDFVAQGEWAFQAEAFCDSYYKTNSKLIRKSPDDCTYWSIGFWTISHRGEVITEEEARRRKEADILRRKELITSNCLTQSQMMATVDFLYQMGSNRSWVKEMANRCDTEWIYNVLVSWRDNNAGLNRQGLVIRDQRRINIFKDTLLTQK